MIVKKDPIQEAYRYIENAKRILSENGRKENNKYTDQKYVKMAGHTAYTGVLYALDALFNIKKTKDSRPSQKDYRMAIGRIDQSRQDDFDTVYKALHLSMGYDGNPLYGNAKGGFECAESLIDWVDKKMPVSKRKHDFTKQVH